MPEVFASWPGGTGIPAPSFPLSGGRKKTHRRAKRNTKRRAKRRAQRTRQL